MEMLRVSWLKYLGQILYKYILIARMASVFQGTEDKFILYERLEKRYEIRILTGDAVKMD